MIRARPGGADRPSEGVPDKISRVACRSSEAPTRGLHSLAGSLPCAAACRYPDLVERIIVDLAKDWLSVADVCEYMDVSPFVVTRVLRSGELPAVKMGREWRVSRVDFEDWLNAQRLAARLDSPQAK